MNNQKQPVLSDGDKVAYSSENGHYAWYNNMKEALDNMNIKFEEVA